jgi:tetratricopeptide (TPR) repeat protein
MAAGLLADATTLTAAAIAAAAVLAGIGWLALRFRGPDRAIRIARRALERNDIDGALVVLGRIRPNPGSPAKSWHAEQKLLETECLYAAAEAALRDRRFADALEYYKVVAGLVGIEQADASRRVVEAMLAEARRLSAAAPDGPALPALLGLILEQQSPCPEATFWLALVRLRHKETEAGIKALEEAHAASQGKQIDPALYLGAVWLREGKPREALKVLAEANRLAPTCPLVSWQLGTALNVAGGDALLALRALQKATAPDGLPKFLHSSRRLWAETLPAESWVRNLAERAAVQKVQFRCPLGLDRVESILQSARQALAEVLVACDRGADAVPIYTELLQTRGDPTTHRGLGLALLQTGDSNAALPHLRQAHAAEKPPTAETTGALAMCLANAGGDRAANARRALGLIAGMNVRADASWARRAGAVFAAAKAVGVPVSSDQVAEFAAVLASTDAADTTSAAVYDLLAGMEREAATLSSRSTDKVGAERGIGAGSSTATSPKKGFGGSARSDLVRACARLYVRAAQRNGLALTHDEQLFDLAMSDRKATKEFFAAREWDFDAAERLYLERWAERHPATLPIAPGEKYGVEAMTALLADARRLASQGRPEGAADVARLVLKLQPHAGAAHDQLAELAFRRGDRRETVERLKGWHLACPADPVPLARLAAMAAGDRRYGEALAAARQALDRVRGSSRTAYLLLAARSAAAAGKPGEAARFLDECLRLAPEHPTALAARAALAWTESDFPTLAGLAERMIAIPAEDPWFHYLAAAAALLAGHLDEAEASARHAAAYPATSAEGKHLLALVRDRRNDAAGAAELLKDPLVASGPAAEHAVAVRGQAAWRGGQFGEALRCWQKLPDSRLKTWNLATIIGGTAFLAGVQALRNGAADEAAMWLRQAATLGHADPRLEALLTIATARAGAAGRGIELLEQAVQAGGPRPPLVRRLARAYRQANRLADARKVLERVPAADDSLALERGLLHLAEDKLIPAEQEFAVALAYDHDSAAAAINLVFARLSLGRIGEAVELLPRAVSLAPPALRPVLGQLGELAARRPAAPWTPEADQAMAQTLRSLGRLESAAHLFDAWKAAHPQSSVVRQIENELVPLRAKGLLDRGEAAEARALLEPLGKEVPAESKSRGGPALVRNLLGICACMFQDFAKAVAHFRAALPTVGDDARVQQNLALVRGWTGDVERSAAHWERFLEMQSSQMKAPPGWADYHRRIAVQVRRRMKEDDEVVAATWGERHG